MDELRDYIVELRRVLDDEQTKADDGEHMDPDDDDEAAVQAMLEDYEEQLAKNKALGEAEKSDM